MKPTLPAFVLLFFCTVPCRAQHLVPDYDPHVNGTPYHRLWADREGNIYVGQHFDHLNGEFVGSLAKLDETGKLAADFTTLITDGNVANFGVQQDGKILISGDFTMINGVQVPNLVRLHSDGSIDESFHSELASAGDFRLQSNEKIIVRSDSRLERLNPDGSLDPTFSMTGYFYSGGPFEVGPDDKIYISSFTNVHRLTADGEDDAGFFVGNGANQSHISAMAVQRDGKLLIGGIFTAFNDHPSQSLVRLLTDGHVDTGFDVGTGPAGQIFEIVERNDNNIIIAGQFTQYNGQAANVVELRPDGTLKQIIAVVSINWVTSVIETPDQRITIGGEFNRVNGIERSYVTQFNSDYTINNLFDPQITYNNPNSRFLLARNNGSVITGGNHDFSGLLDTPEATDKKILQLTPTGDYDETFTPVFPTEPHILSSLLQEDGKLILAGFVQQYNGPTLVRYNADGTKDNTFNIGTGPRNTTSQNAAIAYAIAERNDTIYFGGNFEKYNGVASQSLVAIHPDGSIAKTYSVLPSGSHMHRIAFQSDGKIIVMGHFPFPGEGKRIVRLNADGTIDNNFGFSQISANLGVLKVDDQDRIYIGGDIYTINGALVNSLVRLLPSGNLDTNFQTGSGFQGQDDVRTVELLPNGLIAVGGYFSGYNGAEANGFVLLDQSGKRVATPLVRFGKKSAVTVSDYSEGQLFLGGRLVNEHHYDVYGSVKIQMEAMAVPPAPDQLTVDLQSPGVFLIQWADNATNESGFIVERSSNSADNFVAIDTLAYNVTSVEDKEILDGVTYFYRVMARNDGGNSAYSNIDSLKWIESPAAPDNLIVETHSVGVFAIRWTDNSSNENAFILERSKVTSNSFVAIDTVAENVTIAQDHDVDPGITYFYRARAANAGGSSDYSNIDSHSWIVPPAAPDNLKVTFHASGVFLVSWRDNSDNEKSFILERSEHSAQHFEPFDTLAADVISIEDHTIVSATTYYYRIKAVNDAGASSYSNVDALKWIAPPVAVIDLTVTAHSETEILLTWEGTASGHDGFIVERSEADGSGYAAIDTVSTSTYSYIDKVERERKYFYKVAAYNGGGRIFSNEISSIISGIAEENPYSIYPVPARDVIFVSGAGEANAQWHLLSSTAQVKILKANQNQNVTELDIRRSPPGVYVLQCIAGNKTVFSRRVVIVP